MRFYNGCNGNKVENVCLAFKINVPGSEGISALWANDCALHLQRGKMKNILYGKCNLVQAKAHIDLRRRHPTICASLNPVIDIVIHNTQLRSREIKPRRRKTPVWNVKNKKQSFPETQQIQVHCLMSAFNRQFNHYNLNRLKSMRTFCCRCQYRMYFRCVCNGINIGRDAF